MSRIACISLPEFPLQLLLHAHPEWCDLPAAVVDRDKAQGVILHSNRHARAVRILPGMRYAAALSLASQLRAGVVSDDAVSENIDTLAGRLRFYSPEVEPSADEPGVFWLDADGLSLLYPSLKKWAELVHADLTGAGFYAAVAVGASRFGTYATALTARDVTVFESADAERSHVRGVRLDRLGVDPKLRETLARLGITNVGGFLDLPANGIKKRFGEDVHRLYRLAKDDLFAPLQSQPPREPVLVSVHLDHAETNLERLMAVVERHLQSLLRTLDVRAEVLAAVNVRIMFDDGGKSAERLQPATPTLDVAQILELIHLRLGTMKLTSGVVDVDLELEGTPAERRQGELFVERSPRDLEAVARAFARLRAELGEQAVVRAVPRDGHLPEAQFEWEPVHALEVPRARAVPIPPRVRRVYARPISFSPLRRHAADRHLLAHIDDGSVLETLGPYIVSGGWWQREVQREYYYVRTANGRTLWMYYDRHRMGWYLHGEVE